MTKHLFSIVVAAFFIIGTVRAADQVTLTGVLSDEICGAKHAMPNTTAQECTKQCVDHGADYVLVAKDKVYTLKPDNTTAQEDLGKLAGVNVTVTGEPEADFIWVLSIRAAK